MKVALVIFFAFVLFGRVVDGAEPSSEGERWLREVNREAKKEHEALRKAGLISNRYKPRMIFAALAARASKEDPLMAASTPEQRQFLTEYFKIADDPVLSREGPTYQITESLRRCGIPFPDGSRVLWLLVSSPPLVVVNTPETTRKIEKYMGLEPYK